MAIIFGNIHYFQTNPYSKWWQVGDKNLESLFLAPNQNQFKCGHGIGGALSPGVRTTSLMQTATSDRLYGETHQTDGCDAMDIGCKWRMVNNGEPWRRSCIQFVDFGGGSSVRPQNPRHPPCGKPRLQAVLPLQDLFDDSWAAVRAIALRLFRVQIKVKSRIAGMTCLSFFIPVTLW